MSRVFVEAFFPAIIAEKFRAIYLSSIQHQYISEKNSFLSILFANDDSSEITATIPIYGSIVDLYSEEIRLPKFISVRNPVLCICALIGALLGIYVSLMNDTFGLIRLPYCVPRHEVFYWSISFLFFGLMNVAAIPLHCLLPMNNYTTDDFVSKRIPLPQQYPYLWIMDTFCTGVFSSSLIVAFYTSRTMTVDIVMPPTLWNRYRYVIAISLCGCIATSRFLIYQSTIELELWYLLPTLWAAFLFARELIHKKSHHALLNRTRVLWYYYFVALVLLFSGILVDPLSHRWSMILYDQHQEHKSVDLSWWWDCTRLPAIAFGACDLVFIGLHHHLRVAIKSAAHCMATGNGEKHKQHDY